MITKLPGVMNCNNYCIHSYSQELSFIISYVFVHLFAFKFYILLGPYLLSNLSRCYGVAMASFPVFEHPITMHFATKKQYKLNDVK